MMKLKMHTRALVAIGVLLLTAGIQTAHAEEAQGKLVTIADGMQLILKDSRLIKIALSDKDMAFEDSLVARSALLPHLSTSATKSFYKFQPASKFGDQRVFTQEREPLSYGFDVYQTLFDFGKSISNFLATRELFRARKANSESVKRVALLEFTVAYFDVLEAEKMILVAEKEVESITSYLHDVEHMYEEGAAVKNDLLPAKVRLADARQKLIAARNARENAAFRLKNMLAMPIREKIAVQDIVMQAPQFPEVEEAFRTAQAQRPEVAFFDDQIKASALSERAKAVENFPVLYADGGYARTENMFLVHPDNTYVVLGATMNLYDGGASFAGLLKERARQKQLREQKAKLVEDIQFEIEDSYLGLKNAAEKVAVASDALAQAAENVRVFRARYAEGSATSTEILEAIALETAAQTNYYSDDYELKRGYAKLMYSMGIDLTLLYERMESRHDEPAKH